MEEQYHAAGMTEVESEGVRLGYRNSSAVLDTGIYILAIFLWFLSKLKTGKNLKEDMKKEREKGGEKKNEKSDKTHVKIPLWSLNDRKKSTKTGKNFRGAGLGNFLAGQNIYPWM